jgi:sodium-dependent dicarboxylate transporter 2/3/5
VTEPRPDSTHDRQADADEPRPAPGRATDRRDGAASDAARRPSDARSDEGAGELDLLEDDLLEDDLPEDDLPEDDLREEVEEGSPRIARIGRLLGPVLALGALGLTHPSLGAVGGLESAASWVLALLVLMATWWVTLAIEPAVTALLPAVVLPLVGLGTAGEIFGPYANDVLFLFGGGALLGHALDHTGVSSRLALGTIRLAGGSPFRVLAAVMVVTALISAFVSNLATTATLLPLAIALGARTRAAASGTEARAAADRFSASLLLGIAFASSIGGALTVIGSPPNPIAVKGLAKAGIEMDFVRWLWFSVPTTAVFLPLAIAILGLWLFPARGIRVPLEHGASRPLGRDAFVTVAVFLLSVGAWVSMPLYKSSFAVMNDGLVAIAAAIVLFLAPSRARPGRAILEPNALSKVPWHVLVLFGGGISLADAMQRSGLSSTLGELISAAGALPSIALLIVLVTALLFASEIASNTTLAAMSVPIVVAIAPGLGVSPEKLVLPAAFAASWAFAMPVGTPPNALVFASGRVRAQDMMRAGLVLDVVAIAVIVTMAAILL